MSASFDKNSAFLVKNSTFTQSNSKRALSKIFSFIFSFFKTKGYYWLKCKFYRPKVLHTISFIKCHVNIVRGSGVMTIFVYQRLARSLEIGNNPVKVLPNSCIMGRVRDTKFGTNITNEKLLNTANCQGYSFYRFWVVRESKKLGLNFIRIYIKKAF